ncbi:helix-turn-helix domain-containing protein [Chelatococcus sp. GCM10030263]|uniref:helix-turn-helix domain-containing protein n=1 Tax=Chelatococcus sp. GCM10030263 TaxID=3273387 RepID=UPI00366A8F5A
MPGNRNLNDEMLELRRRGGVWLKSLRESAGLSQRDLARLINIEYYTFVSQIEIGRGRIPAEKYALWAKALNIDIHEFIVQVLRYYEPLIYKHLFGSEASGKKITAPAAASGVDAEKYLALKSEVRELQRLLGKKTLENELLRERLMQRQIGLPQLVDSSADADGDLEPANEAPPKRRRQRSGSEDSKN